MPEWLLLLTLILFSFALRLPRAGAMDSQYDYLTSHTLLVTRVWNMTGLGSAHYSLISNWPNPADREAKFGIAAVADKQGNTYFLSFPPFAFYLSYVFFGLTGVTPALFPLRMLMLISSGLGAWALFWLMKRLWPDGGPIPQFAAAAVFLLSPVSLYYYAQAYFSLILSVPMWMGVVALFYRARERAGWAPRLLCGAACFLLCYTDWLGFLAVFAFALVCVRRRDWGLLGATVVPAVAAFAVTLATYASVAGWDPLLAALGEKYMQRSGLTGYSGMYKATNPRAYYSIFRNYYLGFVPWAVPVAVCVVMWLLARSRRSDADGGPPSAPSSVWELLFVLSLPVLLDHVGLISHTATHRYAVLKAAPALGVAMALLAGANGRLLPRSLIARAALGAVTLAVALWGFLRLPYQTDAELVAVAEHINYRTGLKDPIIAQRTTWMLTVDPQLMLLTERNVHIVNNRAEAEGVLKKLGAPRAYYFTLHHIAPPQVTGDFLTATGQP